MEVEEDVHLGAQQPGIEGLDEEVGGADRVAAVGVVRVDRGAGEENDRDVFRLVQALDVGGGLETVHARHQHIDENDRELLAQHGLEGLFAGARADHFLAEGAQYGFQCDEVLLHVVDDEDAG